MKKINTKKATLQRSCFLLLDIMSKTKYIQGGHANAYKKNDTKYSGAGAVEKSAKKPEKL